MIESPHHSARGSWGVRLVVLHTAEGALNTTSLGRWFARPSTRASSHVGIDDHSTVQYVPYDRAAWTLRTGNKISDNAELCGFAGWNRNQWLSDHQRMLNNAADWVRARCTARGIPIRKLTPGQVAAGKSGVCGHHDWTVGLKDGTHTDPGPEFPWDYVIARATNGTVFPTLRRGSQGPEVARIQRFLGIEDDAIFGPDTEKAVRAYQKMRGIPETGVVDAVTWANTGLR